MIRDRGPNYNIGFGVAPSDIAVNDDEQLGPNPTGSFVAKALNSHPVMRFFAVSAAGLIGMHVASKLVQGGGLKLLEQLEHTSLPKVSRRFQETLLHNYRSLQNTFDEWEGVERTIDLSTGRSRLTKRAGYWASDAAKERAFDAFRMGEEVLDPEGWAWRDEIQQTLIHQARRLPYELPAMYATQRLLTDRMTGARQDDPKTKWYNPIDVVSDFTTQSVKNLGSTLTPWAVGQTGLSKGWHDLMTYGDFATSTSTFNPHIRTFSMNLRGLLALVGHDSSKLLYHTIQRSQQGAGAFSSAITEYNAASRSLSNKFGVGEVPKSDKGGIKGTYTNVKSNISTHASDIWNNASSIVNNARHEGPFTYLKNNTDLSGLANNWAPKATAFSNKLVTEWNLRGEAAANVEAMRTPGKQYYRWKGELKPINPGLIVDRGESEIERMALSIKDFAGKGIGSPSFTRGRFARERQDEIYKQLVEKHLIERNIPAAAAHRVIQQLNVNSLPDSRPGEASVQFNISNRIGIGKDSIMRSTRGAYSPWNEEFEARLKAYPEIGSHARDISKNITQVIQRADSDFLRQRNNIHARIQNEWKQLYSGKGGLVDNTRDLMGESKHPYEMFGSRLTSESEELLIRKTAQHAGIPLTTPSGQPFSRKELLEALSRRGFVTNDVYDMRNFLVDKGVIAKPWTMNGFNILGLRQLSVRDALERRYFPHGNISAVNRLIGDIEGKDAYVGDMVRRPVGKGIYETASGQIIDLSALRGGGRRLANLAQEHLQIPILGINTDILGHNVARAMAESAPIQRFSGIQNQPFLETNGADSYFWLRKRGSRGRMISHKFNDGIQELAGSYRPWSTERGLSGRILRFAIGDRGKYTEPEDTVKGNFKRRFAVSNDQQQSLFGFFNRIRASRKGDLNNPANYAKWILSGNIPNELTQEQAEAFSPFLGSLRRFGITSKVARLIEAKDPALAAKVFQGIDPFTGESIPLSDIKTQGQMFGVVNETFSQHRKEFDHLLNQDATTNGPTIAQGRRAQGLIRKRYLSNESQTRFLDQPTAQAMHSTGIHRRLDEFRADMYRYLMAKEGILNPQGGDQVIKDLLDHLDDLKRQRLLSAGEYTEARAAVLGMQLNFLNLTTYDAALDRPEHIREALSALRSSPQSRGALEDIANYETHVIHRAGPRAAAIKQWHQHFGRADYAFPGYEYNPFYESAQPVPTAGTAFKRSPVKAVSSILGINTWSNPQSFSGASVPISHFYQRLNRYFSTFGIGANETAFKGPLGFFNKGLVGRRILPAVVAGSVLLTADRTLGGVGSQDQYGHRVYKPFVGGFLARGIAHAQVATATILPGGMTKKQKQEELYGEDEVAIRKGRWWPLGNQPFKGSRVQYFRPSWFKRYTSGYQYSDQNWSSPLEKLAYGYDYSPGRIIDPYHWERKHQYDRPYPVSGEYFTGPWGPATGILNATVGQILKPHVLMHRKEMKYALENQYNRVGQYAVAQKPIGRPVPIVATRNPTGSSGTFAARSAGEVLGRYPSLSEPPPLGTGSYRAAYRQPYGFLGVPYGTPPAQAIESYRRHRPLLLGARRNAVAVDPGESQLALVNDFYIDRANGPPARRVINGIHRTNKAYEAMASGPKAQQKGGATYDPYNRTVLLRARGFDPRILPSDKVINPGNLKFQAGQLGYETQEMFGIYGFMFGQARRSLGYGNPDYTPNRPVYQSAARGYGAERSFWDLNLGGLGDLPNLSEGEYGNLEVSEIARRFIPHRRRDLSEVNPLQNDLGKMYPWLPKNDYFINFHQGDPYIQIPEGEIRLPGVGYERTHRLHPDATGKYGVLDQHSILGDVAPWSQEYKAIDKVIRKMQDRLTPEELALVRRTRKQVSSVNKRHDFSPYKHAHTNFQKGQAEVISLKSDKPHIVITDQGELRLAGVRAHNTKDSRLFMESLLHPGDTIKYTYDANRPRPRGEPQDVVISNHGKNINKALLNSDYGYVAQTENPIDYRVNKSRLSNLVRSNIEKLQHRNTIFNIKFSPHRSAVEDWERVEVYGSSFPQWQHPIRDFLKPLGFRAMNRNPFISAAVLGGLGQMFGRTPEAKSFFRVTGAMLGFGIGLFSDAKTVDSGQRFIPLNRRKEMAVDEYTDILNYVKYSRLYASSRQQAVQEENTDPERIAEQIEQSEYKKVQFTNLGPATSQALTYRRNIRQTMYGADVYGDLMDTAAAIPKKKRDHFMDFVSAPIDERPRILSTAPRLERRIYEARWGMKVERRPDLVSYFSEHELPSANWQGWDPDIKTDTIKLKIAQSQGIDASQMGYFPQQIQEANLINPSYPEFRHKQDPHRTAAQLRELMRANGIDGHVIAIPSASPGTRVQLSAGIRR